MAIRRETAYPGRYFIPTINSPQGRFKNKSTPSSNDGGYPDDVWLNDQDALNQSLLIAANITINGNPDEGGTSQVYKALIEQCQGRASYVVESGASNVNAYVLEEAPDNQPPESLFIGMQLLFKPAATSTLPATVSAFGKGTQSIINPDGSNVWAGQISKDRVNCIEYDGSNWVLIDRLDFNSRYPGFSTNGRAESIGITADAIFKNSQSSYSSPITGVTASVTTGILTVKMSPFNSTGGKQIFEITDTASPQKGEVWERHQAVGGAWESAWKNITPPAVSQVANAGLVRAHQIYLSAQPLFSPSSSIAESVTETVGPTGSGAGNIWAAMDGLPSNCVSVTIKAILQSGVAVSGETSLLLFASSGDTALVSNNTDYLVAAATGYTEPGDTVFGVSEFTVPVGSADNVINLRYNEGANTSSISSLRIISYGF